jgi:4-hydroxybutyryl-CoA dehydratase/vinylacetyl-CoA-Delta-isomerase
VDPLLANVGKHSATRFIYEINRLAQDIGGGIQATMPSEADLNSPVVGKYVEKYMKGVAGVPTLERMRILRLLDNMTGGVATLESMHGAGAPQTQRVAYAKLANLEIKKKAACELVDCTYRAPQKKGR